jgi:BirA family biotin operon repressor/biotin-[acetyl-CoA-carboxylase] ligase
MVTRLPVELATPVAALTGRRSDLDLVVRWYPTVSSTMDVAVTEAARGHGAQTVVVADAQEAGRGRQGRAWFSPPGAGLYVSVSGRLRCLADPLSVGRASLATLAAGVGVRDAVRGAAGLAPDLKWPNDLLIGGRKVAGILAEAHGVGTPSAIVVIGVGVNVRDVPMPPDVATVATSLEAELGQPVDRGRVLAEILEHLIDRLQELDRGGERAILEAWRAAAPWATGEQVTWDVAGGPVTGTTAGVDDTGALLVRTAAGLERVVGGEVRWRRLG